MIGHFESGTLPIPEIQSSSGTAQLYHLLKISVPGTIFGKLVSSFAALSPHSIGPERAVSCHTTQCLIKNCAKLFLSELRQIYTDFDNFWQKDGKEAKTM